MSKISPDSSPQGFRSDKIAGTTPSGSGTDIQSLNALINSILAGNADTPGSSSNSSKIA